ncbi:predicted protein [Nematostella vectensis]|uniref:Core-binding (CB) domain-containing protein n=1 Tax=Nematostella vectensis TaxID=45351 RepID=A8DUU7_NEMVE|nr:predicted protein [Nematostella vectensis]|eukprot:XP_001619807.1 hypothetical protein NEMVEDRAFT_v1g248824 [Nematostella vectensis]
MSSNEEEMCLQEIHRKSEKAKAIMRGGQVDQHKYSSSDDDSDEVIPSSPIGKKRSIFPKRALADIHSDTQKVIKKRTTGGLGGEQSSPTLWKATAAGNSKEKDDLSTSSPAEEIEEKDYEPDGEDEDEDEDNEGCGNDDEDNDIDVTDEENELTMKAETLMKDDEGRNDDTDKILDAFLQWLQGIDGDPDELRIDRILNKKHLRDKWLQKLERNRKPGTCKAYLGSLSRFIRFLVVEKLEDLKLTEEHVTKVRVQVQEWSASFKKPFKERRWEKHQEDLEKLITPEDVQKFSKSASVRAAISTLGRYMEKEGSPGQTDFCTVRDHLITRLCIENACRAGPIANMTLRDLDRATKDGDEMIVTILKHKTSASAGPAHVVLSPTVFTWLKAYVKYMRNKVSGAGTDPDEKVFISFTVSEMTSFMISAQLNSLWQKAVGKIRVNAASFRKAAVSVVHEEHQHLRKDLADLWDTIKRPPKNSR